MTLAWTHDTRNAPTIPSRGNYTRLSGTLAGGPLGGDSDWYRLQAESREYLQPLEGVGLSHVLMLLGRIGTMDGLYNSDTPVSIYDRYFLGGANSIRAYKYRRVGPAYVREDGSFYDARGGLSEAFANLEYTIPLWKEKESGPWFQGVRFATFVDGGMVWADSYHWDLKWDTGYGIGLRLDIPFLPLRLDYSWPLQTQESWNESKHGRFSFMIGYGF